jgi:hypothetical protein
LWSCVCSVGSVRVVDARACVLWRAKVVSLRQRDMIE